MIQSIILYGAPNWAETITRNRQIKKKLKKIQRKVALQIISAYRTVSHNVTAILAGQIPLDILAKEYARVYIRTCAIKEERIIMTARIQNAIRSEERASINK